MPPPYAHVYSHPAQGLRRAISRKDWPVTVLRKVLVELMAETPRHVLRRELWASAQGAADHLRRQAAFSRSVAVMSIVGWVLGLGDRHLDNLLLDATTYVVTLTRMKSPLTALETARFRERDSLNTCRAPARLENPPGRGNSRCSASA
jgi:hypothetical protein